MWKDKLKVHESNAELIMLKALQKAKLSKNMFYQHTIVLKATTPDFCWPSKKIAVFLDGPPHLKNKQSNKDETIDELLEFKGWKILRLPYTVPLSKEAEENMIKQIQNIVGEQE